MNNHSETKQVLIHELTSLRQRIAELEQSESERKLAEEALLESEGRFRGMAGEMAVIAEISRVIGSTLEIDEVYERFAAESKKLILVDSLAINLYNFKENTMRVAHVSGVNIDRRKQGDFLVLEGSLSEAVIRAQTGLRIQPANIDEIVSQFPRLSTIFQAGLRSIMCVPLVSRDEVIGVLHFRSKTPNAYTEKDLRLAERIGAQIAGAIANAQLFSDLRQAEEALQRSHNELEQHVADRTEELMRANEELRTEITERKRAEEALSKSEEKYRTIIENMEDGYHEVDLKGNFTFFNESMLKILGYEREDLLGMNNRQYADEENTRKVYKVYNQVYRTGEPVKNFEWQIIRKDGDRRDIEVSISLIRNTEGNPTGFRGIVRDTTERKRAEDALKSSLSLLSASLESTADGILIVDGKGKITRWNQKFADMWKIPKEFLSNHDDEKAINHILVQLTAPEQFVEKVRKLYEQPEESSFDQIDFLDGRVFERYSQPQRIEDNILGRVWSFRDITGRKRAEDALRKSEEQYQTLVENANEAILVIQDGMVKFVNSKASESFGYTEQELLSTPIFELIHPDDRDAVIERYLQKIHGDMRPTLNTYRTIHKSGKTQWIEISSVKIEWEGRPATLNLVTNITERVRAEEEKQSLVQRLNRAEKMESLGILAGGVAHDLNNVLGIVVGYAEMLLMGTDKSSPIRSKVVNIMEGGQKAATIVGDLLTLARRGVSGREVVNLNKIIADWQQSLEFEKLSSYNSAVKIKTELEPDLPNISASSVHLGKTIFNLVSNASEAMKKGGFVTIRTTNQYLDKPIQGYDMIQEGDYVVLSVSDTGEGINADDIKRIFEPFYTKKVMGRSGTGLGLAVVWGTVKDHNGYINVESEEGKGSTFTLYFPVTREELSAETVSADISEYMGKGESILIVDDVKGQRSLAEEMLRRLNYSATSVSSGEEALAYLKEHKADLMILDMIMDPGMDGLDTYRSVLEIHPQQKAIIVSGFSESDRVKAAQALGAGAYVRKPYVIEKLGLAVRKELDRST